MKQEFELIIHYDRIGESDMFNCHEVGELVRCKDCKHYLDLSFTSCYLLRITCNENDFCSRGERKDEVCCRECVHWDRTAGDVGRCTNPLKDEWAICKGERSCAAWQRTENEK